jgi:hypothetical protein
MDESIRGQENSPRGTVFLDGLDAVLGTGGMKGAAAGGERPQKPPVEGDHLVTSGAGIPIGWDGRWRFREPFGGE